MNKETYIGCVGLLKKDTSILLGLRKNCHGEGTWGLPGGHLEYQETLPEGTRRELLEELGIDFLQTDFHFVTVTDDIVPEEGKHYVHCAFEIPYSGQDIKRMEPHKCEEWKFFDIKDLPSNLFIPHIKIIQNDSNQKAYS